MQRDTGQVQIGRERFDDALEVEEIVLRRRFLLIIVPRGRAAPPDITIARRRGSSGSFSFGLGRYTKPSSYIATLSVFSRLSFAAWSTPGGSDRRINERSGERGFSKLT